MALPYIILVLGYTLICSLFLWISISIKGKWIIKFAITPVILWYGLFLYYTPPQLAGYPSSQEILQERVIVRFFTTQRPTPTTKGYIYVVVDTRFFADLKEKSALEKLDPRTLTDISGSEHLRLYRLPWEEELAQNMQTAQKKKKLIILKKNKDKGKGSGDQKGEGKKKKGKQGKNPDGKPGDNDEEGEGGTGGTARNSRDKNKYSVEALTPNEIFKKAE